MSTDAGGSPTDAGGSFTDAGGSLTDAGAADAGTVLADAGVLTSSPRVLSLSVVPPRLYRNDPGASTFSALVTDSDGLPDVVGGRLVDPVSGGVYGVFASSGVAGAYTFSLTWPGMQAVRGVDASPLGGSERRFRAEFFDVAGQVGSAEVPVLLDCGLSGFGVCQNVCVEMASSPTNCGACGVTVTAPRLCSVGVPSCPSFRQTYCPASNTCAELSTSSAHCGACERPVPPGQLCVGGVATCGQPGDTYCRAQSTCANLSSNAQHCGACGVSVAAPRTCVNGTPACPGVGETFCATQNECAALATSTRHCGACGQSVAAPRTCVGGVPRCAGVSETFCPTQNLCVDLSTNSSHCGTCGNALPADSGASCVNGSPACPSGRTWCARQGVCSTSAACDVPTWTAVAAQVRPSARTAHAMAFDSVRQRLVLFGGSTGGASPTLLNDTWEWDGTTWLQRMPVTAPPAREGHAMAFDRVRGRVVLFGGSSPLVSNDTWEWDGTSWLQRAVTGTRPLTRRRHAMTWDAARSRVVLFGGSSSRTVKRNDTWEWDGSTWTDRTPTTSPSPRDDHGLAYSTQSGSVVLVGGYDSTQLLVGDTWEWNGTTWTQRFPATSPAADRAQLAELSSSGRVVLFRTPFQSAVSETWEWTGSTWVQAALFGPSPAGRFDGALAPFGTGPTSRVLVFGGTVAGAPTQDLWGFGL